MSDYRETAREIEREARWTLGKFALVTVLALTGLGLLGFTLNSVGLLGRTVVERKVFENTYQRSEAMKARLATDQAALAEIQSQLRRTDLKAGTRANLEAQAAAIRIRIQTTEDMR